MRWGLILAVLFLSMASHGLARAEPGSAAPQVYVVTGAAASFDKVVAENPNLQAFEAQGTLAQILAPEPSGSRYTWLIQASPEAADAIAHAPGVRLERRRSAGQVLMREEHPDADRIARLRFAAGGRAVALLDSSSFDSNVVLALDGARMPLTLDLPVGSVAFPDFTVEGGQNTTVLRASRGADRLNVTILRSSHGERVGLSGTVVAEGRAYAIDSTREGEEAIVELADTNAWRDEDTPPYQAQPANDDDDGDGAKWIYSRCAQINPHDKIILIGWVADGPTYDLLGANANPTADPSRLAAAVASLNTALRLHSAGSYHFELINLLHRPFRPGRDLNLMTDGGDLARGDQTFADTWTRANTQAADLVVAIVSYAQTRPDEPLSDDQSCGWADNQESARAFVVEFACMNDSRRAFQHEIGHKFGADHDETCCPSCGYGPPYRHDWRSPADSSRGTWLAVWLCPSQKTLVERYDQYSDPNVAGRGNVQTMNVGRLIHDRVAALANFGNCNIH